LHVLAEGLRSVPWQDDALQSAVFNAARLTPIDQPSAFQSIYCVLLDRESGPKAGNLLSFLDRDFVIGRCTELPLDKPKFWAETSVTTEAFEQWLAKEKANLTAVAAKLEFLPSSAVTPLETTATSERRGSAVIEFRFTLTDGKTHCKRVSISAPEALTSGAENERDHLTRSAAEWLRSLERQSGLKIPSPS
jgi:lysyl-tRNA synthetase class 1